MEWEPTGTGRARGRTIRGVRRAGALLAVMLAAGLLAGCAASSPPAPTVTGAAIPSAAQAASVEPASGEGLASPDAPPTPACPGPALAPPAPMVVATVGDGAPVAGTLGSYTILTCSTAGSVDMADSDPQAPIGARPGDRLTIDVHAPWRIVHWEGFDGPRSGEGGNVWPPVDITSGARTVAIAVPARDGDSVLRLELTLVTDDGRAVGTVPVSFWVRVAP